MRSHFLQGLVFYAPVATLYRQANGVGVFQITVIESISLAASLAMELPWGWIADRIGYRNTLVICHFLYFISKIVFWRAEGFRLVSHGTAAALHCFVRPIRM